MIKLLVPCVGVPVALGLFLLFRLDKAVELNRVAIITTRALAVDRSRLAEAEQSAAQMEDPSCRVYWLRGMIGNALEKYDVRDEAWAKVIGCVPETIPLVRRLAPDNQALAQRAVAEQSDNAESWFWMGWLLAKNDLPAAERYYREGLRLQPGDARRWKELGDLLAGHDEWEAMLAYAQSCYHGDPGYNGCLRAGILAERVADVQSAIDYYSLSRSQQVRERGESLRLRLRGSNQP